MTHIPIIVGTVMGTALEVAETVQETLEGMGHSAPIISDFKPSECDLSQQDYFIVCTSNTGMGDIPANITPFYQHLLSDYPAIAGKSFGLINLGDSSYPNFAEAGQTLEAALLDLGAERLGETLLMDAILVSDYDDEAETWALAWGQEL